MANYASKTGHNKYGCIPVEDDEYGHFDSKWEYAVFNTLMALRSASHEHERIVEIKRQVVFVLVPQQDHEYPVKYVADFVVKYADGRIEVIDAKGVFTPEYVIKRKLMLFIHGIKVREWTRHTSKHG